MVELISDVLSTKIEQLQQEKNSILKEKIPECPVNIALSSLKSPQCFIFVIVRSVLRSSRKTSPSSAVSLDITSVAAARPRRP